MDPIARNHDDIAADLKATLAAWREVDPEMDGELVELFMARVDYYIESEVTRQSAERRVETPIGPPVRANRPHVWPGVLTLAAFLIAGSIVFGAHVHAFPPIAMIVLLVVLLSQRRRGEPHRSRHT